MYLCIDCNAKCSKLMWYEIYRFMKFLYSVYRFVVPIKILVPDLIAITFYASDLVKLASGSVISYC